VIKEKKQKNSRSYVARIFQNRYFLEQQDYLFDSFSQPKGTFLPNFFSEPVIKAQVFIN